MAGIFALTAGFGHGIAYAEERYVYVGGTPLGIAIGADGLIVTGFTEITTEDGAVYPLAGADVARGDVIKAMDGVKTTNLYEFRKRVAESDGDVTLTVQRQGAVFDVNVRPVREIATDDYRLGVTLKEDVGGIGTLTFVTEEGGYAALGHHIRDPETGLGDELQKGRLYPVSIENVVRGEKGKAGGLQAGINRLQTPIGENVCNTPIGIYGKYYAEPAGERIRVANKGEARMGRAQVLTTLDGTEPKLYDVDIVKVVSQSESAEKGLVLSVSDGELLDKAGGIVQGMSGSPIIQNGLLVGAVTHVFVTDPTRGYGVHARFMLDNAEAVTAADKRAAEQPPYCGALYGSEDYGRKEAA